MSVLFSLLWLRVPTCPNLLCVFHFLFDLTMAPRPTDASSWLFATVRTLLHRIEVLEALERKPFRFNSKAPVYFPHLPPGLHQAVSENFDFACLFHDLFYNVAAEPEILSSEGLDSQDVPPPDNFIQFIDDRPTTSSHIHKSVTFTDDVNDDEQHEHVDVETQTIDADVSNVTPALDPTHVKLMIEIANKMSQEVTNACVTAVATKLLECMNDTMNVFAEKSRNLRRMSR